MPLSEEELRLLEQMERALVEEDPKLAHTLRGTTARRAGRRKAVLAGLGFVGGVVVLMTGAVTNQPIVGVLGFLVMLGCATVALAALRQPTPGPILGEGSGSVRARATSHPSFGVIDGGRRHKSAASSSNFLDRMEERWRRRREGGL